MKRREIYTYTDVSKLKDASFFNEIKKYPQLVVSTDLKKGLKGFKQVTGFEGKTSVIQMPGLIPQENIVVCDFKEFSELLIPKWTTDATKFRETIILSDYFRRRIAREGDNRRIRNWLVGCRKNMHSILSAIILLEECGITPEEIDTSSDKTLALFVDAWNYLAKTDITTEKSGDMTITSFREIMDSFKLAEKWNGPFNRLFGGKPDKIVIHGFYYFTPIQERFLELLENQGIELIMLFPYDERYPFANEIWELTYSEENGYPPKSEWHMEKSDEPEPYGEIFEGGRPEVKNEIKIKKYDSIIEFADDVRRIKKSGYTLYSTNYHTANAILKDFYPEEYGERKLLSYPIGQFVNTLNQMWDEEKQTIIMNEDRLLECFASGWLMVDDISGKQYIQELTYIMPFFGGCETVVDWEQRIEQLELIQKNILNTFYEDLDADPAIARWQQVMGNPLNQFSPFSVEPEAMQTIIKLIKQLLNMAKELYGNNEPVRVKEHMNKLDYILKSYQVSGDLYDEELKLVDEIFEKLDDPKNATEKGYPSDIAAALNVYLTGRFDEGEIQPNKVGLVSPMYQIDAAGIKNGGRVHICFCDIESMPGKRKHYVWPLTNSIVKRIYEKRQLNDRKYISTMMHIMENSAVCNRYFIYSALKNSDVELSYITNMRGEPMTPSPYIVMLEEALNISSSQAWKNHFITYGSVDNAEYATSRITEYQRNRIPGVVPREAKMDYAICPMKYVLSYVVEKHPTYSATFHQNYAVNGLIAAIYALTLEEGVSQDEIYDNIIDLFPNMRSVEKRQIKDYIRYEGRYEDMDFGNLTKKGDKYYTDERLKVFYPNREVREAAVKQFGLLSTPDGRNGLNLYETSDIKDACIYCPHEEYCRNARFAVDGGFNCKEQEAYYD